MVKKFMHIPSIQPTSLLPSVILLFILMLFGISSTVKNFCCFSSRTGSLSVSLYLSMETEKYEIQNFHFQFKAIQIQ